jgi:triosephosphate isomerase (TIM)
LSELRRRPLIVGNWKMNLDRARALELAERVVAGGRDRAGAEVLLAPPFVYLEAVRAVTHGSDVGIAAQDLHWEPSGAWTGAISGSMLTDVGATHVLVGHSERRRLFGDDDETVARKMRAARAAGLTPILCVGENEEERDGGREIEVVVRQTRAAGLPDRGAEPSVIAYEPIWAIGTGRVARPSDAAAAHRAIRKALGGRARILYGGSVTPGNAASLLAEREIEGLLVGGASLSATSFADILRAAAEASPA